eukprot:982086-Pyramimonas_sp.AAC.1
MRHIGFGLMSRPARSMFPRQGFKSRCAPASTWEGSLWSQMGAKSTRGMQQWEEAEEEQEEREIRSGGSEMRIRKHESAMHIVLFQPRRTLVLRPVHHRDHGRIR